MNRIPMSRRLLFTPPLLKSLASPVSNWHGIRVIPMCSSSRSLFSRGSKPSQIRSRRLATSAVATEPAAGGSTPANTRAEKPKTDATPITLPTNESNPELLRMRHTSAHVMAMAVQKLFPNAQVTIGPWIDNGFYYDFENPEAFTDRDLKRIKKEMDKIIRMKLPLKCEQVSRAEAQARIESLGEKYKLEILSDVSEPITLYHIGDRWWDLCAGPHVEHTGMLNSNAIALESVAGAYWRGDEKNTMLQRIYGTCWETPEQLQEYLRMKEEAKRRDHRVLGAKLGLYTIQEAAGGGLVFWHPKGSRIRRIMEEFWKEKHIADGYELLFTPHVANVELWKTSGHFQFYQESMFDQMEVEGENYQLKPMNCPFHCLVFKDGLRSYRELPLRWAELGTVYRYERSGTLHGLMRVRGFTQDDAHIFCLPEQLAGEIKRVLDLTESMLRRFGFTEFEIMLSTKPEKSVGTDDIWEKATEALRVALATKGWEYGVDEGGGAFYGPKIDVKIKDAIGRFWQCSTIQCDFNLPQRFELEYVDNNGERKQPIMVHRAIYGSVERFFGMLVESYAGEFPLWLAPVQLKLLPVTDDSREFCKGVVDKANALGLRVEVDCSGERLGKMVRNSEQERLPLMAVVGEREVESGKLSLRSRKTGDAGVLDVDDVLQRLSVAAKNGVDFDAVDDKSSQC